MFATYAPGPLWGFRRFGGCFNDDASREGRGRHGGRHGHFAPGEGMRRRRMFDPGALRFVVLQLVAEKPRHGYDVIRALEERFGGAYSPSPGVIYPILQMFEEADYVSVALEGTKKLYTITDAGRAYLEENRAYVDHIEARMEAVASGVRAGEIGGAAQELRQSLRKRLRGGALTPEQLTALKAILDGAREAIDKL
jgi:DNA-binding PadR family transcriptional regulator